MKFIKIMSLILVVAMMAACVVACGGNNNDGTTTSSTTSSTTASTTTSSTTTSSTTTSSTTTSSVRVDPVPTPTAGVELYSNDFSSELGSDNDLRGNGIQLNNGKLEFLNWRKCGWEKNVALDNATGEITISFSINPNLQRDYTILAINDVAVLKATADGIKIAGDKLTAGTGWNQDAVIRIVTVKINPATGDCTVEYAHPDGSQWGEVHTETVNIGAVGETVKIAFATDGGNGFRIDDLTVVQAEDADTKYDDNGGNQQPDPDPDPDPELGGQTVVNNIGNKNLARGESFTETLDLKNIDKTKAVKITFNVTQATDATGSEPDNAILSINGNRTLRVTGGNAMHIWNESTTAGEGAQWNNKNAAQDVTVTIDIKNNSINFVYNNRNVTLTSIDLTGDTLTIKFGGANTPDLVLKNIVIEYVNI